jgi:quercetin dioxygenase-like cupin family protein
MPLFEFDNIPERELMPGFHGRFVHTENNTLALWRIEEGAVAGDHNHPHEQSVMLLEGELDLTVDGEIVRMTPGKVFVIPGDLPHAAKAITSCMLMDVFYPVREDFR